MSHSILSQNLIQQQLAQIDLLLAMFPDEDAISLSDTASTSLNAWRSMQNNAVNELPPNILTSVSLLLTLGIDLGLDCRESTVNRTIQLDIRVPFFTCNDDEHDADEPPYPAVRLVQPSWMSKAEAAALTAGAPKNQDLLSLIENFRNAASCHLLQTNVPAMTATDCLRDTETEPLVRTWFYFPSISTRSKRIDLVKYAPTYALTGFLLSGKPGILCLEGTAHNVDVYMRFIKTESWSDIPAHHKKVTERLREHGVNRAFTEMQEITDTLGNRRGERANRGDMRLLEAWLVERGLGGAFIKVFM
ncbi:hypothetical protein E4U19_006104 [Claviceps sp. Clav32 group G5]|nr:hypothetical protein E4U19_006104 [Claviceps sp. Clav32 group G5]KAG6041391.1 hypothetical protein E4U39_006572 [Claviceps sp. Clav50 group G5]